MISSAEKSPARLTTRFVLFSLLLLCGGLHTSFMSMPVVSDNFLVVIDAGHGGKDPGAVGSYSYEKTVALDVSLKLAKLLKHKDPGIRVKLTRSNDNFVGLQERAKIANNEKADLFISIHCNGTKKTDVYGSETYALGTHKNKANLDVVMAENSVILMEDNHEEKYDGFDPKSEESYIMFKLLQHAHVKQSLTLAEKIQHQFTHFAKRKDRGVKQAGFLVLWKTTMPAVLVELGFITNKTEEKFLNSAAGQEHLCQSLYRAVQAYRKEQGT